MNSLDNGTSGNACVDNSKSPLLYVLCSVLLFLTLVMWCGNLLVISSITYFRQLHSPTNYLILSLAVSDLLVGVVVIPFSIVLFLMPCSLFHSTLCRVRGFFDILLSLTSIFNLLFISIDRYYAVCQPLSYRNKISPRVIGVMIFVSWGMAAAVGFIMTFGGNADPKRCAFVQVLKLSLVAAVIAFYIPAVIMLTIYGKIFQVVRRQARSIQTTEVSNGMSRAEWKATRMLAVVIGVFFICWAPLSICSTYLPFHQYLVPLPVMETSKWLGWLNSMLNPFIYAYSHSWFRSAFRMILSGKIFGDSCPSTRLF